ncbi:MAG: acyltransferase domain-containing protein, partial [Xanthomonadales bacterium]|nr:acyltransferase domain-containing protein [Xanthomonadales bacterium]
MTHPTPRSPIAIIGVSALFPGSTDATGFWRDILAGRDLITDVPGTHWRIEDYYDPDPAAPDKTYAKRGGFLPKVDFDALGWGVPPSQLPATDTSQLLALIVAQQVLEDAARGQFEAMDRSRISVILGVTSAQELLFSMVSRLQRPVWVRALREAGIEESQVQDACARIAAQYVPWQEASFPGLLGNVVAGRIANRLNLGGTNCVTDAACASSLSALAMAVAELELGHSDLAIAGGVDTLNDIFMYLCFSKTPALSPSGDCRPFSDAADGTMLGEGLGMFALKRLADAERDGDRIYAVLRGLGTSSDGRSKSVYAPVSEGQAQALQRAYAQAGYSPRTVELVEAHGTGTKAGDVAEFNGLRMVYAGDEAVAQPWCALGSVKSQIGHTKAAAGAAGQFKAVMALRHKVLPPTVKVERPDPRLAIDSSPFYLNTRARPWIRGGEHPRRAAVSAFGFGGSNFHATLEEYTGPAPRAERLPAHASELVLLHADSVPGLLAKIDAMAASQRPLAHIAHESRRDWRVDAPRRLALVVDSPDTLRQRLKAAAERIRLAPDAAHALADGSSYGVGAPEGGVAFLFPGQGSQYLDMGAALAMQFDAARGVWDQAAALPLDEGLSLHQVVFPPPAFDAAAESAQRARLTATEHAQPALAAHSAALLALLDELGVRADATAGHSFGELMALHAAGACDLPTALQLARARGIAMRDAARSPGAMSAVSAPVARVRELLAGQREVLVANHNGPQQVVVSGPTEAIAAFEQRLAAERIGFARLPVASAFHSPIVAGASAAFGAALARAPMQSPRLPVYANAEAAPYAGDEETLRGQLAVQLSQPVRFVEMIEAMHAAGIRSFVEVGPGQVLCGLVGAILEGRPHQAIALDRKGRDGVATLLAGLARLAAAGALTRPERLYADVRLPPETLARPKHAIAIDGSNLGKPYPPPPGTAMPAPNPPRASIELAAARANGAHPGLPEPNLGRGTAQPFPGASGAPEIDTPEPDVGRGAAQPFPRTSSHSQHTTPEPQAMPNPADFSPAWLAAFQDSQRQAAAAHAAFQQAMADSHAAYLRLTETALAGLGAMVAADGGDGARVRGQGDGTGAAAARVVSSQSPAAPSHSGGEAGAGGRG